MSGAARVSAQAIAELLTGLASAVSDAQEAMAETPATDVFGRALPFYQIPHLDFTFEIEAFEQPPAAPGLFPVLRIAPIAARGPRGSVRSTVSGRVVATPPNAGLPETRIAAEATATDIGIALSNAAGEVLDGEPVELEYDAPASLALHGGELDGTARLELLESQRLVTDANGAARVAYRPGALGAVGGAVILIRAAGSEIRLSIGG